MTVKHLLISCNVFLLLFSGVMLKPCHLNTEGYYWRDYAGAVPIDALPGGKDYNGKPIYIGKILFSNLLIPAKIYEGDRTAYFEYNGAKSTNINIEILCSANHENFEWIRTNNTELHLLTTKNLILGGYQPDAATYIGRAVIEGETTVGKIIDADKDFKGLWTVKDGKNYHFESYEILTYIDNLMLDVRAT